MPLPLLGIAVPVLHSSGAWIASTAAGGYIAGTLSSTWIGAFVLGNGALLSCLGLTSAAATVVATGTGALATVGSTVGAGLTAIGLGGVAQTLGIAPVATFLGLTPIGWAIAVSSLTLTIVFGYLIRRSVLNRINTERKKGGLEAITLAGIVREVRELEHDALCKILSYLQSEKADVEFINRETVKLNGIKEKIKNLAYRIHPDGTEEIIRKRFLGKQRRLYLVKTPR